MNRHPHHASIWANTAAIFANITDFRIPTLCAIAFVLVSALAIILISRYPEGEWITLREVLTTSPACWFWILWFVLAFISANGFTKEYRSRLRQARDEYPLVDEADPRRLVKKEMSYRYSKMLLPGCLFWILWFVLAFVSANGFTKEYRSRHHLVASILINQYEENIDKSLRM